MWYQKFRTKAAIACNLAVIIIGYFKNVNITNCDNSLKSNLQSVVWAESFQ